MPWRQTKDPYKIWVSEIMLQQTQVQTVIPYYEKWVKRFPDLSSLASAPEEEVMKFWAGLGYYRRARMLHKAAKILCSPHLNPPPILMEGEQIPSSTEELLKLPGIGRYTAGAVASFAFGADAAILDTNAARVLARVFGAGRDRASPRDPSGGLQLLDDLDQKRLWNPVALRDFANR